MEIVLGRVRLTIPDTLQPSRGHAIDSASAVFEGGGISVVVDQGPFADDLGAYGNRSAYRSFVLQVDGQEARMIRYADSDAPDPAVTVGIHVGGTEAVTVVVRAPDEPTARRIVDSLRLG